MRLILNALASNLHRQPSQPTVHQRMRVARSPFNAVAMKQLVRLTHQRLIVAAVASLMLAVFPFAAHATNYGEGLYNSNNYNGTESTSSSSSSSSSAATNIASPTNESTVVKTPSGLEVAINLADGQAIPSTGYYITITPINGQGKTFDKAEIYLDGKLAYSSAPDSTGTLKWFWDTNTFPATKVKIIVYGPDGGVTTHEFNVTITPVSAESTQPTAQEQSAGGWPMWAYGLAGLGVLGILLLLLLAIRRRRS